MPLRLFVSVFQRTEILLHSSTLKDTTGLQNYLLYSGHLYFGSNDAATFAANISRTVNW
jgi:hypothetical protein